MGPIIMKICIKNARISRNKSSGPCLKKNLFSVERPGV